MTPRAAKFRIGIDVGGTFTDVLLLQEGETHVVKVPTTPESPLEGVFQGLEKAASNLGMSVRDLLGGCSTLVHGTTLATNMMVQLTGARVGLITTEGFRDTLAIRRGRRESIWDIRAPVPPELVPRHLRLGVRERIDSQGRVQVPLDEEGVRAALGAFKRHRVESVAVGLFNAYANDRHEQAVKALVREEMPEVRVFLSSEVWPVLGEYERVSTTAVHAYVAPGVIAYLEALDRRLRSSGLRTKPLLVQSNGGVIDIPHSLSRPALLILSGPAAGAAAALRSGRELKSPDLLLLDMGGTSCDITLIAGGRLTFSDGLQVGGYHIATPAIQVTTIGAGGGTVAYVDPGGMLRVGPRGVGARPGPACYGLGGSEPTVTDANLVLGRLNPHHFLGGELPLDPVLAERAIVDRIARPLGLSTLEGARAIVQIANQNMMGALRTVSVQQGHDPRRFLLIAGGGAGPLHVSALARELGIERFYVPRDAAVYSALGLLHADLRRDYVRSYFGELAGLDPTELRRGFRSLLDRARQEFEEMGISDVATEPAMDLRYRGQHWETTVNLEALDAPHLLERLAAAFHDRHEALYGHRDPGSAIEVLNLRLTAMVRTTPMEDAMPTAPGGKGHCEAFGTREVFLDERGAAVPVPIFRGHSLIPGDSVLGPAVVEEPATTLFLAPGDRMEVDPRGNYMVHREKV